MAPVAPLTQQVRLLAGLAITGAIPLTVGVILWIVGTVMRAVYHGGWGGTASLGEVLVLAGVICGGAVFALAAAADRWARGWSSGGWASPDEPALTLLASPQQQAHLADARPDSWPDQQPPPPGIDQE